MIIALIIVWCAAALWLWIAALRSITWMGLSCRSKYGKYYEENINRIFIFWKPFLKQEIPPLKVEEIIDGDLICDCTGLSKAFLHERKKMIATSVLVASGFNMSDYSNTDLFIFVDQLTEINGRLVKVSDRFETKIDVDMKIKNLQLFK